MYIPIIKFRSECNDRMSYHHHMNMYFHTSAKLLTHTSLAIAHFMLCRDRQASVTEHHNQNNSRLLQFLMNQNNQRHTITNVNWKIWKPAMERLVTQMCFNGNTINAEMNLQQSGSTGQSSLCGLCSLLL